MLALFNTDVQLAGMDFKGHTLEKTLCKITNTVVCFATPYDDH